MVKFKDLEHPQNIVSLHVQRRNMFWISIEKSIEVAVWCFPFFFFKSNFPYRFARSSRWIVMPTKKLMDDKERHRQKNKNTQQLVDELNPLLKLKGNTDGIFPSKENNKREKSLFVRWRRRWRLRRIYIPSGAKPGRRETTEARWRFGGSAPRINHPPGRATKTGIGCGTAPPARQAVCVEMRGNRRADNGKEIRLVSQTSPRCSSTLCMSSDRGKRRTEARGGRNPGQKDKKANKVFWKGGRRMEKICEPRGCRAAAYTLWTLGQRCAACHARQEERWLKISPSCPSVCPVWCVRDAACVFSVNFCTGPLGGGLGRESWTELVLAVFYRVFHLPQTWEQDTCGRRQVHRRGFCQKINTRIDFSVIALLSRASRSLILSFANGFVFTREM